jgi:hypothetical protein
MMVKGLSLKRADYRTHSLTCTILGVNHVAIGQFHVEKVVLSDLKF